MKTPEQQARAAFEAAGLNNYRLRLIKGVWVAVFRGPSVRAVRRGNGPGSNYYAALRPDGTTTLGVHDLLRYHLADALSAK